MYGGAVLAGAVLFMLKSVRKFVVNRFFSKPHRLDAEYFKTDRKISEILIDLRAKTEAGRVCLFQFHNGQVFLSAHPIWRASCTHKACTAGVSSEMRNRQSILASNLSSVLTLLFENFKDGQAPWPGVIKCAHGSACPSLEQSKNLRLNGLPYVPPACMNCALHVGCDPYYLVNVLDMPTDSFCRQMFLAGGAHVVCIVPLTHQKQLIGFLTLCFTEGQIVDRAALESAPEAVANIIYEMKMKN